ncbi:hypothetical protein FOZ63_024965, partial [Perkinsus olseni]
MRIHLVTIGISLVRLVDAEYKYYCDFMDEMVAQCIGKRKGGRISTLSQHGALIQPAEQSNDIRFTSDVCDIQDRPEGYGHAKGEDELPKGSSSSRPIYILLFDLSEIGRGVLVQQDTANGDGKTA